MNLNVAAVLKIPEKYSLYHEIKNDISFQNYNDCGGQAIIHHKPNFSLSILFPYFNCRMIEAQLHNKDINTITDDGSSLEEFLKAIVLHKYLDNEHY